MLYLRVKYKNKNMSDYTIKMRNVLEIRLKERRFSFFDYRGKLIDFLIENYGGKKIKYLNNGGRIDVATEDLKEVFFFGAENFGSQFEAIDNFDKFKDQINKTFKIIEEFELYKFKNIVRIGLKSYIYCHKDGRGEEAVKGFYKEKMFKDSSFFEKISTSKIVDLGYSFADVEINDSKANIMTGPVGKEEALAKFFENREDYNDVKKPGIIYIIDCYNTDVKEGLENDEIKEIAIKNVDNIEKSFNGFRDYIFEKIEKNLK